MTKQSAESIFGQAIEIQSDEDRAAFLNEACGRDQQLRGEVEKLVADHFQAGSFLEQPVMGGDATAAMPPGMEQVGSHIGPYKLRERLGEGGMGVVWAAEQKQPLRRKVALKVIKPGMDTQQVIARFEAEREALALMDHPNIARVLDAGTTEHGRPYFVMELIRGVPITEYCDAHKLTIRERLELFTHVCKAVQHAHQKGIIHRDIKPSNVLVTEQDGNPVPKVIDFGVAKALYHPLTEKSVYTGVFQAIGTLAYMSPEQATLSASDVDTRADVYGLGALLYEVLTGTAPFSQEELASAALDEACRIIREKTPPKPSTMVSSIHERQVTASALRRSNPRGLRQSLKGAADLIVMKALEKDRNQRYESASELAADVMRFLHGEPVEACPPSIGYRLRKLWANHRVAICGSLGIIAALAIGLAFTGVQVVKRGIAERNALRREREAQAAHALAEREREKAETALYFQRVNEVERYLVQGITAEARELLKLNDATGIRGFENDYTRLRLAASTGEKIYENTRAAVCSVSVANNGVIALGGVGFVTLIESSGREIPGNRFETKPDNSVFQTSGKKNYWSFPFATISRDAKSLAYVSPADVADLIVRQLDISDHTTILRDHGQTVRCAAFLKDGDVIATGDHDGFVRTWNFRTGEEIEKRKLHDGLIWSVAISPGDRFIASGGADNRIVIWDQDTNQTVSLEGHYSVRSTVDGVISVAFSPDGRLLASGGADRTVRIWSVNDWKQLGVLTGHLDEVRSVAFSPDGKLLASGGRDNSVRLWSVETYNPRAVFWGPTYIAHSVAFSHDGKYVVAASFDGTVFRWDVMKENVNAIWRDRTILDVELTKDGTRLAAIERGTEYVSVWTLDAGASPEQQCLVETSGIARAVAWSSKGILATLTIEGIIEIWRVTAEGAKRLFIKNALRPPAQNEFHFHHDALLFSHDGNKLAAGSLDGEIYLLDLESDQDRVMPIHDSMVRSLVFSTDDRSIISAAEDGLVIRWDLQDDQLNVLMEVPGRYLLAVSPCNQLAIAGRGKPVCLIDLDTEDRSELSICAEVARFLDDKILVVSGGYGTRHSVGEVIVWDKEIGRSRIVLRGHTGGIECLDTSAEGQVIVSGGFDRSIRIWRRGDSERRPSAP